MGVVQNLFNSTIIFFILCALILFACGEIGENKKQEVEWNGDVPFLRKLKLSGSVRLDSTQFSNGLIHYTISGMIHQGNDKYPFDLLLDANPKSKKEVQIISQDFPFSKINSRSYKCDIYNQKDRIAVEWKGKDQRLTIYIAKNIIVTY